MCITLTDEKPRSLIICTILLILLISQTYPSRTPTHKLTFIQPSSIQYLSNSFSHILTLFLPEQNKQLQILFQQYLKPIIQSYPNDNTLYAVTYFKNDTYNNLEKYNNKQTGVRLISNKNYYQMNFQLENGNNVEEKMVDLLNNMKKFYMIHVHPILPILQKEQYNSVQTQQFVVMQYSSHQMLQNYTQLYSKIYDYLKIFNIRAIATQSNQQNTTKIHIYNKNNNENIKKVATFGGEISIDYIDQLVDFINVETLEYLTQLNDQNYVRIFGSFLDTQFLLIYDEKDKHNDEIQKVRKVLQQTAKYNKEEQLKYQRILFAQSTIQFMGKYFDNSILSSILIKEQQSQNKQNKQSKPLLYRLLLTKTDYGNFQLRRFYYNPQSYIAPSMQQSIMKFIQDVRMKRIDSEYRSQPIPTQEQQSNNKLCKIVGRTFIKEIFQKPQQSIIVLFIDSKQPQSYKQIQSSLIQFTNKYSQLLKGKVTSGVLDLALNQNKMLTIKTAPLLVLFEKTNKKSPKFFRGYPKVESIKNWVNYQVKDISIPDNFGEPILPLGGGETLKNKDVNEIEKAQL